MTFSNEKANILSMCKRLKETTKSLSHERKLFMRDYLPIVELIREDSFSSIMKLRPVIAGLRFMRKRINKEGKLGKLLDSVSNRFFLKIVTLSYNFFHNLYLFIPQDLLLKSIREDNQGKFVTKVIDWCEYQLDNYSTNLNVDLSVLFVIYQHILELPPYQPYHHRINMIIY